MTLLSPCPKLQFFDNNGDPLSGGKVFTYAAGTTTPETTYTDITGSTANTNPVILDARGEASIWLTSVLGYKFVLKNALDELIYTVDNINGTTTADDFDAASSVSYDPPGVGAVPTNVQTKLRENISVKDFGAVGNGVTDDTAAFSAAFAAIGIVNNTGQFNSPSNTLYIPAGIYRVQFLDVPPGVTLRGAGRAATQLRAVAGYGGIMVQFRRPLSIPSSRTRNYGLMDLTITGSSTPGCIGLNLYQVAEIAIDRVNIGNCDKGVDGYDVVTGHFSRCIVNDNLTHGIRLRDGCNGIQLDNTRLRTTVNGPNIEIDGEVTGAGFPINFQTLGVLLNNCIIESALSPINGIGAAIGPNVRAFNVVFNGCYFEANETVAIRIGSPTASPSVVTIVGGNFAASGKPASKGIEIFGGRVSLVGQIYLDGIPTGANRLILENGLSPPAIINTTTTIPAGTSAANVILGTDETGGFKPSGGTVSFFDSPTNRAAFIRRPSDVAFTATGKYLWVQSELRTNYQGNALLSSGVYDVVFSNPTSNASYAITLGSEGNNHLKISTKSVNGFRISAVNSSGVVQTGDNSRVHWHVFRNQ